MQLANDIHLRNAMEKKSISRWQSLMHAMRGLKVVFKEPNAKIHVFLAWVAAALGVYFQISNTEWIALCFAIASVIGAEAINTAVEKTVDLASPDWHETAGQAKDAAAAAVLIASIGAAAVGAIIFAPRLF
jgi:diacylglycerol kinase